MSKGGYRGGSTIIRASDLARRAPEREPVPIEEIRKITDPAKERAAKQQTAIRERRERWTASFLAAAENDPSLWDDDY